MASQIITLDAEQDSEQIVMKSGRLVLSAAPKGPLRRLEVSRRSPEDCVSPGDIYRDQIEGADQRHRDRICEAKAALQQQNTTSLAPSS